MATPQPSRDARLVVPKSEPFLFTGGATACVLLHGFTASPEEMLPLGRRLARNGHTVMGVRLAGHATHPRDLSRTLWTDWLADVEDALALCRGLAERVVLIGQSMGGMIAFTAAARFPVSGVVAVSTPYELPAAPRRLPAMIVKPTHDPAYALADRREPAYPAYPMFPSRILRQVNALAEAMRDALPRVSAPVLMLQSTTDLTPDTMATFLARLGSADKSGHWLKGLDHSIVRDRRRAHAFDLICAFVDRLVA